MLESALAYARAGWRVMPLHNIGADGYCTCRPTERRPKAHQECPSPGKHPRIKTGRAFEAATTDEAQIRKWWTRWPNANIGIATGQGSRLCVVDIDGQTGFDTLNRLLKEASDAGHTLPTTLTARSGRQGVGAHLYFICDEPSPSNSGDGLDIRGDGGNLVAPPSMHISGQPYAWVNAAPPAPMPAWLLHWFRNRDREARPHPPAARSEVHGLPEHLRGRAGAGLSRRLEITDLPPIADVEAALEAIPNDNRSWDEWNRIGMAVWRATGGSEEGLDAFDYWSQKSRKYDPEGPAERWRAYEGSPPDSIGYGSLWYEAKQADPAWSPPSAARPATIPLEMRQFTRNAPDQSQNNRSQNANGHHANNLEPVSQLFVPKTPDEPLIRLNKEHAVIGNLGGKCMVMEWVESEVNPAAKVLSFQTFKAFAERYSNEYIDVEVEKKNGDIETESKQVGAFWLRWPHRKSFTRIRLEPNAPKLLPGNVLNLWQGWAIEPKPGRWDRMREHITDVLADGDSASAGYILKYAAWCLQNPGELAEVALVFQGEKGSGKGMFARALKDIFGQHGLQVFNPNHLTGNFNAHLRTCLLLFADEAFWAGDKPKEGPLKGLITEPQMMIEQKGVDAVQAKNRLKVVMAANAEWAVPASARERRYEVVHVSDRRVDDRTYFGALSAELKGGGLAGMAHDLLQLDLGSWHPRQIVKTRALQEQKRQSLEPMDQWFCSILESGVIPAGGAEIVTTAALYNSFRDGWPQARGSHEMLGKLMRRWGLHHGPRSSAGTSWRFPGLLELRAKWAEAYGGFWPWEQDLQDWHRSNRQAGIG